MIDDCHGNFSVTQVIVPQTEAAAADNTNTDTKEPGKVVLTLLLLLPPAFHSWRFLSIVSFIHSSIFHWQLEMSCSYYIWLFICLVFLLVLLTFSHLFVIWSTVWTSSFSFYSWFCLAINSFQLRFMFNDHVMLLFLSPCVCCVCVCVCIPHCVCVCVSVHYVYMRACVCACL